MSTNALRTIPVKMAVNVETHLAVTTAIALRGTMDEIVVKVRAAIC